MKIRSSVELNDAIDETLSWRKKELILSRQDVDKYFDTDKEISYIRFGIVIHYAHWEGFIIDVARIYLNYISAKNLYLNQTKKELWSLEFYRTIKSSLDSKNFAMLYDLSCILKNIDNTRFSKKIEHLIDSNSNLNSKVLKNIVSSLALDYTLFEAYEKFLDEVLLQNRNQIAHGKKHDVSSEHFLNIHNNVLSLMNLFKNTVENAVTQKSYLVA